MREEASVMYRHYLAMILAIDDMVGNLREYLERSGKLDDTVIVFSSDHGSQGGAHGTGPWLKKHPHDESLRVPTIVRYPGVIPAGVRCSSITTMPDFFPTLCRLCDVPIPRSVEGRDLSDAWRGLPGAFEHEGVLLMNFSAAYDWLEDGMEWRGVRTPTHTYARWLDGTVELYDRRVDPLEMENLAGRDDQRDLESNLEHRMLRLMARRGDALVPLHAMEGLVRFPASGREERVRRTRSAGDSSRTGHCCISLAFHR